MTELLTAAQMRAIEEAAIASGEVTGLELMERAGRGVVEAIFEEWPEMRATSHRAVVLCGPGNNGGDGFVVARLLKEWGWEVEVFLYGDPDKMPPDARANYERWLGMGEVRPIIRGLGRQINGGYSDVIIDAIFGTGLSRPLPSDIARMISDIAMYERAIGGPAVVSIDVPTGICSDSGRSMPHAVVADLTVPFGWKKIGHELGAGAPCSGKKTVKSIGLKSIAAAFPPPKTHTSFSEGSVGWVLLPPEKEMTDGPFRPMPVDLIEPPLAWLGKQRTQHKYTHGHTLILSGPPGHTGAARLAARGALRIGAGLVTVGAEPAAIPEHAAHLNAIMLREVADAAALADVLTDARITALCLGPGLGLDARAEQLVRMALEGCRTEARHPSRSLVLDADALTILSRHPDLFAALHENCVLTPHGGEFARLFPDIAAKLSEPATKGPAYSKVDATREAAARAGCVVLFKGPDTVIADPSGRCSINSAHYDRAAPWLATAGSGDVLAGFITGLLARGFQPMQAAETAAWLHVECARKFGPGLIAEDLPEVLPAVFRDLGL